MGSIFQTSCTSRIMPESVGRYCQIPQEHGLEKSLDSTTLLRLCKPALENGTPVSATLPIRNVNRAVGTMLGSYLTRRYGAEGLPADTIQLSFSGSAGQSFGAFLPPGLTLKLEGDANDYVGKGLSGGKIIVSSATRSNIQSRRERDHRQRGFLWRDQW